jgi:glucokinase
MVIGVDLGGTNVRAGVVANGIIYYQRKHLFNTKDSLDATLIQLIDVIRPLVTPAVKGIGIGVPSVVDVEKGVVFNVANIPSWERVPLKDILEDEFRLPVAVNNDVNCFILGEHRHGLVKGLKTVVGMASGTGLGTGIIINNALFHGNNCGAGEIGLVGYREHNIEYYASGNFFEVHYNMSAEAAHQRAIEGNTAALESWKAFGAHMGHAVKTVVYVYDPEAIVIGGSLAKAFKFFAGAMHDALKDFTFPESIRRLKILQSENENIALLGAAALIQKENGVSVKVV